MIYNTLKSVFIQDISDPIEAVQLADGRRGITLRSPCDLLQIARNSQSVRIKRNPKLAASLLLVPVELPTGPQVLDVLLNPAISIWLAGLQTSRLAPEKQALAMLLRERAIDAIEAAFSTSAGSAQKAEVFDQPHVSGHALQLGHQALDAHEREHLTLVEEYGRLVQEHQLLKQDHQALTRRVEALESGRPAQAPLPAAGQPATTFQRWLSLDRIGHVYVMARTLREARGRRIDETLQRMAAEFGVEDMSDLPDERWREMTIWLNKQWG